MIPVNRPFLPPIEDYQLYLKKIWASHILTNIGPLSMALEKRLKEHLKLENLLYVTNGTTALQMAIRALDLKGDIITTPFSFVATTSAIVWQGCKPIFVDIDPKTFNIDPEKIESAITKDTAAILATHVYGNPCDMELIADIAERHRIKVIYDGAHAFGVKYKNRSIFNFGDISISSLHATKTFHSIEGGLINTSDDTLFRKLYYMRNFGIKDFGSFDGVVGTNGKNSEFHAAVGLANLKYIEIIHQNRLQIANLYDESLKSTSITYQHWNQNATKNYTYYPILFPSEHALLRVIDSLSKHDIQTRRYFYPTLPDALPYVAAGDLPMAKDIARRVLCLPFYYGLHSEDVYRICDIILDTLKG